MKFLGVDHIDMIVEDLTRSIEYYRKFGMQVEGTVDAGETVFLWNGDDDYPVRIELHKQKAGETLGIDHLSFLVDDPVQAQKEVRRRRSVAGGFNLVHDFGHTVDSCFGHGRVKRQINALWQ